MKSFWTQLLILLLVSYSLTSGSAQSSSAQVSSNAAIDKQTNGQEIRNVVSFSHKTFLGEGEQVLSQSTAQKLRLGEQLSADLGKVVLIEDAISKEERLSDTCLSTKVVVDSNVGGGSGGFPLRVQSVSTSCGCASATTTALSDSAYEITVQFSGVSSLSLHQKVVSWIVVHSDQTSVKFFQKIDFFPTVSVRLEDNSTRAISDAGEIEVRPDGPDGEFSLEIPIRLFAINEQRLLEIRKSIRLSCEDGDIDSLSLEFDQHAATSSNQIQCPLEDLQEGNSDRATVDFSTRTNAQDAVLLVEGRKHLLMDTKYYLQVNIGWIDSLGMVRSRPIYAMVSKAPIVRTNRNSIVLTKSKPSVPLLLTRVDGGDELQIEDVVSECPYLAIDRTSKESASAKEAEFIVRLTGDTGKRFVRTSVTFVIDGVESVSIPVVLLGD